MRDMGDEELMLQTQRGNVYAFELLFERYRARVFGFILRTLNGRRQEAEELMQDIFLKLFKAREMYEPRAKFSTWLFTIVRNHCLNYVRSQAYLRANAPFHWSPATSTRPLWPILRPGRVGTGQPTWPNGSSRRFKACRQCTRTCSCFGRSKGLATRRRPACWA